MMMTTMTPAQFKRQVEKIVSQIPFGKVMTYGQIAALCGKPNAARIVGGIAHYGDLSLPWHRVVNKHGGLARGYLGGMFVHQQLLENEGIVVTNYKIDIVRYLWHPQIPIH